MTQAADSGASAAVSRGHGSPGSCRPCRLQPRHNPFKAVEAERRQEREFAEWQARLADTERKMRAVSEVMCRHYGKAFRRRDAAGVSG